MKQLPSILLNVTVVVVAIVVYDRMRSEPVIEAPPPGAIDALEDAVETLKARLDMLEQTPPPPLPESVVDARLLERIQKLERRLESAAVKPTPLPSGAAAEKTKPAAATPGEPSPEAIEKFAKLQAAARQRQRSLRLGRLVDKVSEENRISLTDEEREKLIATFHAFEPRRNEIWAEAKAAGAAQGGSVDWDVVIRRTNEVVQREFMDQISGFVSGNDAMVLARALSTAK